MGSRRAGGKAGNAWTHTWIPVLVAVAPPGTTVSSTLMLLPAGTKNVSEFLLRRVGIVHIKTRDCKALNRKKEQVRTGITACRAVQHRGGSVLPDVK
jgi:hypothetical protein